METAADLESQLVESLNAITTIKRFGIEGHANMKTESRFVRLLRNTYVSSQGAILASSGIDIISSAVTVAVLWIGSNLVIGQSLTPGSLMIFYSLIGYVLSPIGALISSNQTIQDAMIAADRLFQILDLETEDEDGTPKVKVEADMLGDIVFENVAFRYGYASRCFRRSTSLSPRAKPQLSWAKVGRVKPRLYRCCKTSTPYRRDEWPLASTTSP